MLIDFKIKQNPKLFIKDPEGSEMGKQIVATAIGLIQEIGYEQFTFKKLASKIPTTEATIYRYFENKHKLLIYLIDIYWSYIHFQIVFNLNNVSSPKEKIKKIIDLLVWEDNSESFTIELDQKALFYIAIAEGSKTYLSKDVDNLNKDAFFKPYKDICEMIEQIFKAYNPNYKFCKSLASSLVETSHSQYFFMQHLPRLSDFSENKDPKELELFLENMVFGALNNPI